MSDRLTEAQLAPYVGESFRLALDAERAVELELVEVSSIPLRSSPRFGRPDPFSIVFRGPLELALEQGTYTLTHPRAGSLAIFLVPIAPDEEGRCYEAVFA